ncbi:periplasmic binding protein [Ammonifex degensii KC4]|uniref:Periplasmic binding protein n=1 Tax=Ammonifex degensii (strain DSM 10501 / KC4) TaxID=429009 RepID=C9RB14_AMMDK|nr:ABC transporter substrate-binding protein [Ammonifex degensii]ACX51441.1 periplasmic binding protein [Ammonifex degensii KC4]
MRRYLSVLVVVLLLALLAGCRTSASTAGKAPARELRLAYAKGFKIEYLEKGCKLVTDGDGKKLLLCPRGEKPPAGYENIPVVYTPVKRVVVLSTTQAALLKPLGELGSIVGVSTPAKDWYIPEVKRGIEEGRITYLGKLEALDYEKVLALKPDVVFTYTKAMGGDQAAARLRELGVPVAVDNEWLEENPLGRLEWIKFLAAFYDKGKEAESFFAQAEKRVRELADKLKDVPRTKVVWVNIWGGKVYVPRGNSYTAQLIAMAGGDYLMKNLEGVGSAQITPEEFYQKAREAEVMIYASSPNYGTKSVKDILKQAPLWKDLPAIQQDRVYCLAPDYWQSLDELTQQLQDLAAIFHPDMFPGHKTEQFLKLPKE